LLGDGRALWIVTHIISQSLIDADGRARSYAPGAAAYNLLENLASRAHQDAEAHIVDDVHSPSSGLVSGNIRR
jgi:hypothetical protein